MEDEQPIILNLQLNKIKRKSVIAGLKLSYLAKKIQNFLALGAPPSDHRESTDR